MKNIIFGTAGHIDHGKSSLVKFLTGNDPDRLDEEKKRGITIDLGFAHMANEEIAVSFVDVPGHEKLVKNMIAGATGFDAVLFAVDAVEGVKPQTVEHLNIINTIGVRNCIVAVTKSDLAEPDDVELRVEELTEFFGDSGFESLNVVPVSIYKPETLEYLKTLIYNVADESALKNSEGAFVLRIDRSFSVKGFGTVVTGTAVSGALKTGDFLHLMPDDKLVKVKGLNVHGQKVETAYAGQRVAVNISDADVDAACRGKILISSKNLEASKGYYAKIKAFDDIDDKIIVSHNKTYRLFLGTEHTEAKVLLYGSKGLSASEEAFCFLRLNNPYTAVFGERFVIRGRSPEMTIAGGKILALESLLPDRKKAEPVLEFFDKGLIIEGYKKAVSVLPSGIKLSEPVQGGFAYKDSLMQDAGLKPIGDKVVDASLYNENLEKFAQILENNKKIHADEIRKKVKGASAEFLFKELAGMYQQKGYELAGEEIRLKELSPFEKNAMKALDIIDKDSSVSNPAQLSEKMRVDEKQSAKIYEYLANRSYLIRIEKSTYVTKKLLTEFYNDAVKEAGKLGGIELGDMKKLYDLPRKLLVPLMDYLDKTGKFINKDRKRFLKK